MKKLSLDTIRVAAGIAIYMVDKYIFSKNILMKKLKPKPYQFWAWCSTLTILAGALTAALDSSIVLLYFFNRKQWFSNSLLVME